VIFALIYKGSDLSEGPDPDLNPDSDLNKLKANIFTNSHLCLDLMLKA
jgi:hypothetical protein